MLPCVPPGLHGRAMITLGALCALLLLPPACSVSRAASLPHVERLAPGVYAAGFADRHQSATCGWVALDGHTLLVGLPRGMEAAAYVAEVARSTGKRPHTLVLTSVQAGDGGILKALGEQGITRVLTSPAQRRWLLAGPDKLPAGMVRALSAATPIGDAGVPVDFLPCDGGVGQGGAALYLPRAKVLFAGPVVVNGPRAPLADVDTSAWLDTLARLEKLGATRVVPGRGTWGGAELLSRQRRFLTELRRQVGHAVAQGQPVRGLAGRIRLPASCLVWAPYDTPTAEDIEHVYRELTVPAAPFNGRLPDKGDARRHALVLIGDGPHEPGTIEEGLRPVFEAAGVTAHFTVDVKALSAENLRRVQLLVMLRDGLQRPGDEARTHFVWMTPEQERAVVEFVEGGGGFVNLHNALALYPADGPYLKMLAGRYTGHGPLERFRVEVVDRRHPVTRGVDSFSVADEQHTPVYDAKKVTLLLQGRSDEGKVSAAGWVREVGRGRLCHLANGHTREALLHPMFQRLLRNAVRWCLRQEGREE